MRKPETSFEDILFRVDSVEASWNNLGLVIKTVRQLDKQLGSELSSTIDDLIDRLSYHVNKSLFNAANPDIIEEVEAAITELMIETGVSPLISVESLVELDDPMVGEDAYLAEDFPFDPDFVGAVEDGGSAIHNGETLYLSILTLKNGVSVLVNMPHEVLTILIGKYRTIVNE